MLVTFDKELMEQVPVEEAEICRKIVEQGFCATKGDRLTEVVGISAPVSGKIGNWPGPLR